MRYQSPKRSETLRFTNLRPKFSIPSLLLAGAVSLANLSAVRDASALSGTLTSASVTTTPRESSGAAGGATLIHTAASTTTSSAPETSSTTTQTSDSAESGSRASGGSRRRAQTEEGSSRRRRTKDTAGESGRTTTRERRTAVDSKDSKESKQVTPVMAEPARVNFSLSSGYETRYIYHGIDIISFNTVQPSQASGLPLKSSGIMYDNADVAYAGAHFGVGYIRAISPTYPYLSIGHADASRHRSFYQEVDVNADYTASIVGGYLDATAGYDSYFFADRNFRGSSYQGNLNFRLAFTHFKFVVPSFNYFHYFSKDNFATNVKYNGNYVEFRLDGSIPVIRREHFSLEIAPYLAAGYNIDYLRIVDSEGNEEKGPNGNGVGGWNDLEMGVKINTRIGKHLTVTPYGNYGMDLHGSDGRNPDGSLSTISANNLSGNGYGERTHFWGGVTVAYTF